jgi:cell division protein FtsQ
MNRREGLSQAWNSKTERARNAPEPLAWSSDPLRWSRKLRRWTTLLLNTQVPRGAGASVAALFLLASVSYGAVRGGHVPEIVANLQTVCDAAAINLGFRINDVTVAGGNQLSSDQILELAGVRGPASLLFLDASEARARLLSNPWIEKATVLKLYPGSLHISIQERTPFALWQKEGQVSLISKDGTVLETSVRRRFASLPIVVGRGAERAAPEMLALIARYPGLASQINASVLVAERRWNLHLKSGVEVLLPENNAERALRSLIDLDRSRKLLSRDIVAIDFRLPDRVTVRQSQAAWQARDAALKSATEKDSKKKKGGEA